MQTLKTERCIICGKHAKIWHGYVVVKKKMALGNYIDKKIIAGFCSKHTEEYESKEDGFYGNYNSVLIGECIPMFPRRDNI